MVAESLIEKVYGCGVRENWMPKVANGDGGSLSIYVPAQKGWRQTWIDSSGAYVDFKGGWDGHAMVLTGDWPIAPDKPQIVRMTYTKGADGSVRQPASPRPTAARPGRRVLISPTGGRTRGRESRHPPGCWIAVKPMERFELRLWASSRTRAEPSPRSGGPKRPSLTKSRAGANWPPWT